MHGPTYIFSANLAPFSLQNTPNGYYLQLRRASGPPGWTTQDGGADVSAPFGKGALAGCAFVEAETVYAYASHETTTISMYSSSDLWSANWTASTVVDLGPGYRCFNSVMDQGMLAGQVRKTPSWPNKKLGQLQPFIAVFPHECMG
jgi:hypothetical protein